MKIARRVLLITLIILILIPVFLILWVVFLMGGSDFTEYPDEKATHWVCEDPHIEISYSGVAPEAYLEWEGRNLPIYVGMHANSFTIYLQRDPEGPYREEDILVRGSWKYVKNMMVFEISTDNIFNGAYTELVFVPQ